MTPNINSALEQSAAHLQQALVDVNVWLNALNVWIVLGIVAGAVVLLTLFLMHRRTRRLVSEAFEAGLQQDAASQAVEREKIAEDIARSQQREAADRARLQGLEQQLGALRDELSQKRDALTASLADVAATTARLDEAQRGYAEKEKLFRENSEQLKKEFEHLANKVFDQQGERQRTNLQSVLTPFKDQIVDFKKRVEEVYHTDTKERASLLTEIKNLQSASERINEEAENLTKALKGDKKLQGNWGELVLERVLEESGLRKDHEYFLQVSRRSSQGDLKRPDVLIRLPDNKDVIIDSKVSLNAYEEALASEDEETRGQLLKQHMLNMRGHVKRLSEQDYDKLNDVRSLDFVLMFVPIESAFTLAMEVDQRLFTDAFTQRIVIVSPTTLMMTLRIINNVWRYEKQNRNAQEIAKRAGALYDKLHVLVEQMDKLGKQMASAEKTYSTIYAGLATGKANLVRQVEKFRELGAVVKKPMPPALIDKAADED